MHFSKESLIRASAAEVFAFHERKDALELLQPPWQRTEILEPPRSLAVGTRVRVRVKIGPIWQTVVAEHIAYEPGHLFADRMLEGPFTTWVHRHIVTPKGERAALLTDDIEYELPLGGLGRTLGGWLVRRSLERLFAFRHEVTRAACERLSPPTLRAPGE